MTGHESEGVSPIVGFTLNPKPQNQLRLKSDGQPHRIIKTTSMKHLKLSWALALLVAAFGLTQHVRADNLTNNFTAAVDYFGNGIVGDTNWDGVYLALGDIPGGNDGGNGPSSTQVANSGLTAPGFLTVSSTAGNWAGAGDDGFFLYKVVNGDFDASVQIYGNPNPGAGFQSQNYHLPGILARAWNTNNTGSPQQTDTNGPSENWVYNARFQEFSISEHGRYATNGADHDGYFNTAGADSDTNTTRYVRITRVGDVFSFYEKTNQTDTYAFITNLTRTDLHGVAMQVGIDDGTGTANSATTTFTDFELSGPNVTLGNPGAVGAPSALVTTATNIAGSLTFSWTPGNAGDSSLVIVTQGHIQVDPVQGLTYPAGDPIFGASDGIMGANQSIVYNGTGHSVTVTNLGANIFNYTVAVFEYTNTGTTTIYNTATPATGVFAGPGAINSVQLIVPTNNIPLPGAVHLGLLASFSTGQTNDESANTAWSSSDATIATVDGFGTVSAVGNGTVTITGTIGTFTPTTNITVHTAAFADNFTNVHDYLANGLPGSMYDGMFTQFGDFPNEFKDSTGPGNTLVLNSQITSTNGLQINSTQTDWQGIRDDGTFLFKIVPGSRNGISGDFEASMQVVTMNTLNFAKVGIMARLYDSNTASFLPDGEDHLNYYKVQNGTTLINGSTSANNIVYVPTGPSGADNYLMMQRVNATNFYFYERATNNVPWIFVTNVVFANAANDASMEVGIAEETRAGVTALATIGNFTLDAGGVTSATQPPPPATNATLTLNGDLSMTLNWVAADSLGNPVQSVVVMRANKPVSAQPSLGQPLTASTVFGTTASELGAGNYVVFVSSPTPASTNNTVTVTGLAPGVSYYASIYTFAGSGSTAVFNTSVAVTPPNVTDGFLVGMQSSLAGGIPVGGVGQILVLAFYAGAGGNPIPVDKSAFAVVSSSNTNIIQSSGTYLSGIATGTIPVTNSFTDIVSFTNVTSVTVRAPFFTDNFTTAHDYIANGVAGTGWDDLYNTSDVTNPIPGSPYVGQTGSGASVADADISTNNMLTITSAGDGWENNNSGGFFLFKYVPGDFQASVHINSFNVAGYNQPGILARGYTVISNGLIGAPLGYAVPNAGGTNDAGEYWEDLTRFDEFGIGTYARDNVDSAVSQNTQSDQGDNNFWLLIWRTDGTNFNFFKRLTNVNAWVQLPNKTTYSHSYFAGQPMQVGLMSGPWTGGGGPPGNTVRFEDYMLDIVGGSPLTITKSGTSYIVSWPPITGTLQQSSSLSPQNWQPVAGTPVLGTNGYSLTVPATPGGADFFRLVQ